MQKILLFLSLVLLTTMCKNAEKAPVADPVVEEQEVKAVPEWSKNANIYEVNVRQHTPEGTINAFTEDLPRLKELGVDILWLMPIHPIGVERRKGGMGSPYSIIDYKAFNPDYGTDEDFKNFVNEAHKLGFKVILDWVANHTSFDNVWVADHKEWYTQNEAGEIIHPEGTDWTDVADLNFDNKDMRAAMIDALEYWVKEFDVDGYRCDVAGSVPADFWKEAIPALHELKHVFMLAEADEPWLHDVGFQMSYGWGFHHVMNQVAQGKEPVSKINEFLEEDAANYKPIDYRMNFTTNHDENSWNGTVEERMGDLGDAMTILAFTVQGMPLIYSGQEAGLNKRLSFFEKDTVDFSDTARPEFFKKLLKLKHENEAIWNGTYGGDYKRIKTTAEDDVFAFERTKGDHKVMVFLNLSDGKVSFEHFNDSVNAKLKDIFTGEEVDLDRLKNISLDAGGYWVLAK